MSKIILLLLPIWSIFIVFALYLFLEDVTNKFSNNLSAKNINVNAVKNEYGFCKKIDYKNVSRLLNEDISKHFSSYLPSRNLSESSKGTINRVDIPDSIAKHNKIIFLTFDACGQGGTSDGYDSLLVDFLIEEEVPVNFFISMKWAKKNEKHLEFIISKGKHIALYNHGKDHIPISSKGDSIYGIKGTENLQSVFDEVEKSAMYFCDRLGYKPKYFRAGTAHTDELSVKFIEHMGYKTIGYSVLGDAGATFSEDEVLHKIINSKSGDIILLHFNHPESDTYKGVKKSIKYLKNTMKVEFGILEEYENYFHYEL